MIARRRSAGRGGFRRRNGGISSIEDLAWQILAACAETGDWRVRPVWIVECDPRVDETHTACACVYDCVAPRLEILDVIVGIGPTPSETDKTTAFLESANPALQAFLQRGLLQAHVRREVFRAKEVSRQCPNCRLVLLQ